MPQSILNPADDSFAKRLASSLPQGTLTPAETSYLTEPRGRWTGVSAWMARPRNTAEVSRIVTACNEARVGIVPYGGGTGLVGGQVAQDGPAPLLLALDRMTSIRATYPEEYALVAEAGAILTDVQSAAAEVDRLFALSLASEGSARIGGLLSTNAGGLNVLRYGNARDQVLGLEAVLPDGQIWHGLKRLRKDNTGYDLRHLMIGAEGTLGVITAASLKLASQPANKGTALLMVESPEAALTLLSLARSHQGEAISTFEIMHRTGFDFMTETMPDFRQPWDSPPEWSVLIELGLPQGVSPQEALEALFGDAFAQGLVSDGLIAQSLSQAEGLRAQRETIPEANRLVGAVSSHDISLPLSAIPDFIREAPEALAKVGTFRINCFGHLGDGNLHYNVFPLRGETRAMHDDKRDAVKRCIHDLVHARDGSVSAEHGIGRLKVPDLERYGDPVKLAAMRAIKTALDPNGIMNPGAMLSRG